jgi:competence protein ComEA
MSLQLLQRYRGHIYLTLALASVFGLYTFIERQPQPEPIQLVTPTPACVTVPTPQPTVAIRVHVVGAVVAPGVYVLGQDARIVDAVQAAGGMAADADPEGVNLADRVSDGQQLRVPFRDTRPGPTLTPMPPGDNAGSRAGEASSASASALINLNTATAVELERLPGIGPVLAQRIVAHREAQGPFGTVEEIMRVSGIGEAIHASLRDLVVVE